MAARAGVATGEAIATSASVAMVAELAGERFRARAFSLISACAYLGGGLAAIIGGSILQSLSGRDGFSGWRVAMVVSAVPSILIAAWLIRFRSVFTPGTVEHAQDRGVTATLVAASMLAAAVQTYLSPNFGVPLALAIALAAATHWFHRLRSSHRESFDASLGNPNFVWLLVGFSALMLIDFAASFWLLPYAQRRYGASAGTVGIQLGSLTIGGGILGSVLAGIVSDRWCQRSRAGRVWTVLFSAIAEATAVGFAAIQPSYERFLVAYGVFALAAGSWTGVTAAIGTDIVPRRASRIGHCRLLPRNHPGRRRTRCLGHGPARRPARFLAAGALARKLRNFRFDIFLHQTRTRVDAQAAGNLECA